MGMIVGSPSSQVPSPEFEADTEAEGEGDQADVVRAQPDPYQGFITEVDDAELDVKDQGIFDSEVKDESSGDCKPPEKRRRTLEDSVVEEEKDPGSEVDDVGDVDDALFFEDTVGDN